MERHRGRARDRAQENRQLSTGDHNPDTPQYSFQRGRCSYSRIPGIQYRQHSLLGSRYDPVQVGKLEFWKNADFYQLPLIPLLPCNHVDGFSTCPKRRQHSLKYAGTKPELVVLYPYLATRLIPAALVWNP